MPITSMVFAPNNGLNDVAYSPSTPASETAIRAQIQGISNQLRDYINNTLIQQLTAANIPVATIAGVAGSDVQTILANILAVAQLAQAGTILPGSITDAMLSNIAGQIKDVVNTHIASDTALFATKLDKNGGTLQNYSEVLTTNATATGAVSLNITNGNVFDETLTGNTTFTFDNPTASGKACSFTLILRQGSTAYSVTYPASVKWANDVIPSISTINKTAIISFVTVNGGARWYGSAINNLTT